MANYTSGRISTHKTLTGTAPDTISCPSAGSSHEEVTVVNRSGAGDLTVTFVAGSQNTPTVPVALADDTRIVPPGLSFTFVASSGGTGHSGYALSILGNGNGYSIYRRPL